MNVLAFATRGERTRAHIITIAAGLFWRRSFHGVAVDEVATAAEVNKATIYRYFADKRDLALAVVRQHGSMTLETIFALNYDDAHDPDARLAAIFRHIYYVHVDTHKEEADVYGCPIVGLALELGQDMPEIREEAQKIFDRIEEYFSAIAAQSIAAGKVSGDAATLARTLTQLLHGAFASARVSADPSRVLDAGHACLTLIGYPDTPIIEPGETAS